MDEIMRKVGKPYSLRARHSSQNKSRQIFVKTWQGIAMLEVLGSLLVSVAR